LRRLAAIGAAYVSSYLRPVEADREGVRAPLRSLRRDLIDPRFALHRGRALKPAGALQAMPIVAG
jgi:adenylate cyclase